MRTALYYPSTEIKSKTLLRSALLTWDRLEFIAPFANFRGDYQDREMAEAVELIGYARAPSELEKKEVHLLVEDMLKTGVPETLLYEVQTNNGMSYGFWPQKLMHETWDLLQDEQIVRRINREYHARQNAGLTLMAMLADVMGGDTRARVTDQGLAYAAIANAPNIRQANNAEDFEEVVSLTYKSLNVERVSLRKLIELRKREEREAGHGYRSLRHNYLARVEKHVADIAKHPIGTHDRVELDRIFQEDMEDDLKELKQELGFARNETILSRDTLTFAVAAAALFGAGLIAVAAHAPFQVPGVITLAGLPVTVGGFLCGGTKYAQKRIEVLQRHPTAYLFQANQL